MLSKRNTVNNVMYLYYLKLHKVSMIHENTRQINMHLWPNLNNIKNKMILLAWGESTETENLNAPQII